MFTNERRAVKTFNCATYILRNTLSSLGIVTVGLSRTDCLHKLHVLGHDFIYDNDQNYLPSKKEFNVNKPLNQIKVQPKPSLTFPRSFTDGSSTMWQPTNILSDSKFSNLSTKELHIHKQLVVKGNDIGDTIQELLMKQSGIESMVQTFEGNISNVVSNLSTKFDWNGFSNISNPYIRVNNAKGKCSQIKNLLNTNLKFDTNKSFIFVREFDNMYDITIELKQVNIRDDENGEKLVESRTYFEMLDISSILDVTFTDNVQIPFLRTFRHKNNIDYAMSPGGTVINGTLWLSTTLFTTKIRNLRVKTPNLPVNIKLNYTTYKPINKDKQQVDKVSPFVIGVREFCKVTHGVVCNWDSITLESCTHSWVDSDTSVTLNTHTKLLFNNLTEVPSYIKINCPLPKNHQLEQHIFNGAGILYINSVESEKVDLTVSMDTMFILFDKDVFQAMDLNTIHTLDIVTFVRYNVISDKQLLIKTRMSIVNNLIDNNIINISNISVFDTINNKNGNLELFEFYEIQSSIVEIDHSIKSIFPEMIKVTSNESDGIKIEEIRITDNESVTYKNKLLRGLYKVEINIREVDTSSKYVQPFQRVFNNISTNSSLEYSTSNLLVRYEDIISSFRSNPYVLDKFSSIEFTLKQHHTATQQTLVVGKDLEILREETLVIFNDYLHIPDLANILEVYIHPNEIKDIVFEITKNDE